MDNKQNRQFYWEVKDFMAKKSNVDNKKPESLKESVKKILNEKNLYKTTNFIEETPLLNSVANHINKISHLERGYVTNDIRHARNNISNPFYLMEDEKSMAFMGAALKTAEQNKKNQEGQIASLTDLNTLSAEISAENEQLTPGVPLTREQRAKRDLEGTLKAQQQKAEEKEMEADRIARGLPDPRVTEDGREYSPQPDFVKPSQPTSPVSPQPTEEPAPQEDRRMDSVEDTRARAAAERQADAQAKPTDPQQAEKDKFRQTETKNWERRNTQKRQAAEQQLAALNAGDESKMSDSMRARRAANRVRLQQEIEGSKDLSSDEISRRVESSARTRFASPEEKAARELEKSEREVSMYSGYKSDGTDPERDARMAGALKRAQDNVQKLKGGQPTGTTPAPGTAPRPTATTPAPGTAPRPTGTTPAPGTAPRPTGTTPAPGTAPRPTSTPGPRGTAMDVGNDAQAMSDARSRQADSMFGGGTNKPQTNTPMTGGQVTSTARETLGLGSEPKPSPTQPTTPGMDAARETLGLGKPTTPEPQESEAKKKARDILLNK